MEKILTIADMIPAFKKADKIRISIQDELKLTGETF